MRAARAVKVREKGEVRTGFDREDTWFKRYEMLFKEREKHGDGGHPRLEPLRQIRVEGAALLGEQPLQGEAKSKAPPERTKPPR
jgi:hypothetical protein